MKFKTYLYNINVKSLLKYMTSNFERVRWSILYHNISSPWIEELYLKALKILKLKAIIKDLLSVFVRRHASCINNFTSLTSYLKLQGQLLPCLSWSISIVREIKIVKCMALPPGAQQAGPNMPKISQNFKNRFLYTHTCDKNWMHVYFHEALYQNCKIQGLWVKG